MACIFIFIYHIFYYYYCTILKLYFPVYKCDKLNLTRSGGTLRLCTKFKPFLSVFMDPPDPIFGDQKRHTTGKRTIQGFGSTWEPSEHMSFALSFNDKNNPVSDRKLKSPRKIKICIMDGNNKIISMALLNLMDFEPTGEAKQIEVSCFSPRNGKAEGRVFLGVTARPLKTAINMRFQQVMQLERRIPSLGWGNNFLPSDPNFGKCNFSNMNMLEFSDKIDKASEGIPPEWVIETPWTVDNKGGDVDGWVYGRSPKSRDWVHDPDFTKNCRRRGWYRYLRAPTAQDKKDAREKEAEKNREEKAVLKAEKDKQRRIELQNEATNEK